MNLSAVLLIFCVFHLSDGRLDFWNDKSNHEKEHIHDINPDKLSPVIFSKYTRIKCVVRKSLYIIPYLLIVMLDL